MSKRTLVTSALPYANGPLHIGHLAGAYLPADIYVRYQRLCRHDILFICGSDEHGVPIMLAARKEGVNPKDIADRYHDILGGAFEKLDISFDHYGRTSSEIHHETSKEFFSVLAQNDAFITKTDEQLYDPEAKLFLADRFVRGTCPNCGYEDAYGDQCEKCGKALSPTELLNPRSAVTDTAPELRSTTHWYLTLDTMQEWLEQWVGTKTHWKPNVLGQIKSWLKEGLVPRSITRDLPWGITIPEDVAAAEGVDAEGKVLYVWFDAPIGYISATREWARQQGTPDAWKSYWQDDDSRLLHFIGKDNIVFHCIIFPVMLQMHGAFILPENVPANEFLNLKGLKFSTSRGVAVWAHEFVEKFHPDYLRYALTKILPERNDSDFSWEGLQAAVNNELADTLGNFVNRCFTFAKKHFDGCVPPLSDPSDLDVQMLESIESYPDKVSKFLDVFRIREALDEAMNLAREGNRYFNDSQPWATRKTDMSQCGNTIHVSLQVSAALSVLLEPFLPSSMQRLRDMLGVDNVVSSAPGDRSGAIGWSEAGVPLLKAGARLGESQILFKKLDDAVIQAEIDVLVSRSERPAPGAESELPYEDLNETIVYDDFAKLDLRVGVVVEAEKVPKSKKLIRTIVDLGFERRQVLAGVALHMSPEELVGSTVVVVANLAPRKLMGLESQGMLLMAEDRDGRLVPVRTDGEAGAVVR